MRSERINSLKTLTSTIVIAMDTVRKMTFSLKQFTLCQSRLFLVSLGNFISIAWSVISRKSLLCKIITFNQFNSKKAAVTEYTIHNNLFRFISF